MDAPRLRRVPLASPVPAQDPRGFPDIAVEPASLGISLPAGGVGEGTFLVKNLGNGVLVVHTIEDTAPWMTEDPVSFTVLPNGAVLVTVSVDGSGLTEGIYDERVSVSSNDPDEPDLALAVRVHVMPGQDACPHARAPTASLEPPTPSPIVGSTALRFSLQHRAHAELSVIDLQGRCLAVLARGPREAGSHEVRWSPQGIAPGVYLIKLDSCGVERFVPAILLR